MSDDKNTAKAVTTGMVIAVPVLFLFLYFLTPVLLIYPISKVIDPSKGPPTWLMVALAPITMLADKYEPYQDFLEWQAELVDL